MIESVPSLSEVKVTGWVAQRLCRVKERFGGGRSVLWCGFHPSYTLGIQDPEASTLKSNPRKGVQSRGVAGLSLICPEDNASGGWILTGARYQKVLIKSG